MKLKFKKTGEGRYLAAIHSGNGGVSSLVASKEGPFWFALSVFFKIRNWVYYFKYRTFFNK